MHHKTARMALAGCLPIGLAMGSLAAAAQPQHKIADFKFSGALSEADRSLKKIKAKLT